jgi:hypothetical protein
LAAASAKDVDVADVRIALEMFLDQQGQALHALAHVRMTRGDPDPDVRWDRDHLSARRAAVTRAAGALATMLTRAPPENSTTIAGSAPRLTRPACASTTTAAAKPPDPPSVL